MPPQNRLAPPLQNSLAYSVPAPLEPGMLRPVPARFVPGRELENLSIGLGRGLTAGLEGTKQLLTQPVATARALVEAARQMGTDPGIVLEMLRAARQKAMSGSLGLGELIGENVTPGVRGRTPIKQDIFIGKKAKTWDAAAAARAEQMERAGASPEEIWQQTGTFRSPDGMWRQEVPDLSARLTENPSPQTVEEFLAHPAAFQAYPDLAKTAVNLKSRQNRSGAYFPATESRPELIEIGSRDSRSTLLHEMQHAIQEREGFAKGGPPTSSNVVDDFKKSISLNMDFRDKMIQFKRLRKEIPFNNRPKLTTMMKWDKREFDIDDLLEEIEAGNIDPKIKKEMLGILEELESKREKIYGTQVGLVEQANQYKNYLRIAGEAEARAVETRASYAPGMLRQQLPTSDYDVPLNELTFITPGVRNRAPMMAMSKFPRVDEIKRFSVGPASFKPRVIAENKPLFRETSAMNVNDFLQNDRQFDYRGGFVTDDPTLAIGQGLNKGVFVQFRPNSVSGEIHAKPGTGVIGGVEYKADILAPMAVERVTFKNPKKDFKSLAFRARQNLAQNFTKVQNEDGSITFIRKMED